MKEQIIRQYLEKLKTADSIIEIDSVLNEIIPLLASSGVSLPELMVYFKVHQNDYETKSQDHQNSISNSNKTQLILQRLMAKLGK
ncbi:hypothetical protein LPB87_11730 [Flavobacterium sp. EDS]|jgi:hypothetical protein|uniref:hypothetical protein n=1 Tax=Flavobacterium sp. EDS TaxID=2897328 RepID=UPI001E4F2FA7|nr:hypothetical protein [Flavobacterium sp. EDS]MCD0475063.1 hypothetical protein [Flavobacterium sp. EDS]